MEGTFVVKGLTTALQASTQEGWHRGRDISYEGMEFILSEAVFNLGVSRYGLAKLLGLTGGYGQYSRWQQGRNRIGSLYMARLCYLFVLQNLLQQRGVAMCHVRRMNWSTGEVYVDKSCAPAFGKSSAPPGTERPVATHGVTSVAATMPVAGKPKPRVPDDSSYETFGEQELFRASGDSVSALRPRPRLRKE
jgi:hypothetical protein